MLPLFVVMVVQLVSTILSEPRWRVETVVVGVEVGLGGLYSAESHLRPIDGVASLCSDLSAARLSKAT